MRYATVLFVLLACKGGSDSTKSEGDKTAGKPTTPTPVKPKSPETSGGDLPKDKALALCEKLIDPALRSGMSLDANGHYPTGDYLPGRLSCFVGKPDGTRAAVTFVDCAGGETREHWKKSLPGFKDKDGNSPWKSVAGPGLDAMRVDGGYGGLLDGSQFHFWDEQASCGVSVSVAKDLNMEAFAAAFEKALGAPMF